MFSKQDLLSSSKVYASDAWETADRVIDTLGANYLVLVFAHNDNSTITLDEAENIKVFVEGSVLDVVQKDIINLNTEIEKNKANPSIAKNLPDYWMTYMNNKIGDINEADISLGFNGVSFAFITDIHSADNALISPILLQHIKNTTNVKDVICGGDVVTSCSTYDKAVSELLEWRSITAELNIVNLRGNHDNNANLQTDSTAIISDASFYAIMCKSCENTVNWETNKLYGYKDNLRQKVRYIFLDTKSPDYAVIDDVQVDWMKNKITELEEGWTVVLFAHQFFEYHDYEANGTKIKEALDSIYDNSSATIACVIAGHAHYDMSTISEKGYQMISTTCDACRYSQTQYDSNNRNRELGTTSEQTFDLFYINTVNRTINTIRIGAGENRSWTY